MVNIKNRSEFIRNVNSLGFIQEEKDEIIIKNKDNKQIGWISLKSENCFQIQMDNEHETFKIFLDFIDIKPTGKLTTKELLDNIKNLGYTYGLIKVLVGGKVWKAYNIFKNNSKVAFVEVDRAYTFNTISEELEGLEDKKLFQEIINYSNTKLGDRK